MAEFKKSTRNVDLLLIGEWRLASVNEVKDNLDDIKKKKILDTWDIARLLDGWVDGPGYGYHYAKEYKPNLGHMVLIKTEESRRCRKSALSLSTDDENIEVMEFVIYIIMVGDPNTDSKAYKIRKADKNRKAAPNED